MGANPWGLSWNLISNNKYDQEFYNALYPLELHLEQPGWALHQITWASQLGVFFFLLGLCNLSTLVLMFCNHMWQPLTQVVTINYADFFSAAFQKAEPQLSSCFSLTGKILMLDRSAMSAFECHWMFFETACLITKFRSPNPRGIFHQLRIAAGESRGGNYNYCII